MLSTILIIIFSLFFLLLIVPRLMMAVKTARLKGKAAPTPHKASAKRINSGEKTILYFYTPSCRACTIQDPIIQQVMKKRTNLTKFYRQAKRPKTCFTLDDFYKNQIVKCALFKDFMRVMDVDKDLNQVYIYKIDELSDVYVLKPNQLSIPDIDEEIVELLYM